MKKATVLKGPNAGDDAEHRAKFGHKDWLVYKDRTGELTAEVMTKASIKRALLAVGTNGRFTRVIGSVGNRMRLSWRTGINQWLQMPS